jgi:hypothetical protein
VGGVDAFLLSVGDDGAPRWALSWGGKYADAARAVAVDAAGNVYVAGSFQLTMDFDPGPGRWVMTSAGRTDAFVLKLDANRRLLWARRFGGSGPDAATALAVSPTGDVWFGGTFEGPAWGSEGEGETVVAAGAATFVAALGPDGGRRWLRRIEGDRGIALAGIGAGREGDLYIGGTYQGSLSLDARPLLEDPAGSDLFAVRLDRRGDLVWFRDVGAESDRAVTVESAAVAESGLLLAGSFRGDVDFDPGAGRSVLAASTTAGFVLALGADGSLSWVTSPASGFSQVLAVAVGPTGDTSVVGVSRPDTRFGAPTVGESSPEGGKSDVYVALLGR